MSVTDTWAEWKTDDTNKPSGLDSPEIDDELRNIKKQVKTNCLTATNVLAAEGIREYATLPAAITAIGTSSTILLVDTAVAVSTNATMPSTLDVSVVRPGMFNISSGVTLTINGTVDAGAYQIFACTSTGKVVLNNTANVLPEWWGAVGDGTADDAVALTAAMTNCAATGSTLVLADKTYKFTTALSWLCHTYAIRGSNATLLASSITGFALIARDVHASNLSWYCNNKGMSGVRLTSGGAAVTGKHGLYLGDSSGTTYSAAMVPFQNVVIDGFDTGIEWGSNSYLQKFDMVEVYACTQCLNYPTGLTNSGENISFTNSAIFNSTAGLKVVGGNFNFYGCAFDYMNEMINASGGAKVCLFGGHMEGDNDSVWITSTDTQTYVGLSGVNIYNAHADAKAYRFGLSDDYADFHIENCYFNQFTQAKYPLTYLVDVTNHGYVTGRNNNPQTADSALLPLLSSTLDLLVDGGFETSYTVDWTSTGTEVPVLDNTDKHAGTYSLKFAPTNTKTTKITMSGPCRPGDRVQVDYWIKNTFGASPNTFTAYVMYLDRSGADIVTGFYSLQYSAAGTHYDTWTQVRMTSVGPAPKGAYTYKVGFDTGTSDGVDVNRIDDVAINIH